MLIPSTALLHCIDPLFERIGALKALFQKVDSGAEINFEPPWDVKLNTPKVQSVAHSSVLELLRYGFIWWDWFSLPSVARSLASEEGSAKRDRWREATTSIKM